MIGKTLSHYKVLEKLGSGGMGEVYIAEDTKLSRKVALKVLPPEMAENAERRARFEREAKAVAALDHPNIVTIYSVEEAEGVHFYTMQLVKGKTLTELIPKKGMALNKFFEIAIPLADSVSAAHEQGIIHRDLKPDNLMVGDDGRLKILDFGLAKLKPGYAESGISELPTQSATAEGRILGTVAYMSPEQAEGKQIDHRSDIFSIGIILYETATGERPFKGDTAASLLSSILKDKPQSATEVNPALPRDLGKIIRRCLAKDPTRRYQSALDIRNELEELKQDIDSGEVVEGAFVTRTAGSWKWILVAAAAVLIAPVAAYLLVRSAPKSEVESPPLVNSFAQLTQERGREFFPTLSPDGRFVAYAGQASGNWDLYLQRVEGGKAINLTQDSPADDTQPAFSPDGERLAFRSERDGGGIFVMGTLGESAKRLSDFGYNPSWSPDGKQIVCTTREGVEIAASNDRSSQLWSVSVETAETKLIHTGGVYNPTWSPDGRRIAYCSWYPNSKAEIWTLSTRGGEPVSLTDDSYVNWFPIWSRDGTHIYFSSDRGGSMNIWRVRIEEETGEVLGEPEAVTTGVATQPYHLTFSRDGRQLAYSAYTSSTNLQKVSFDPTAGRVAGDPVWITTKGGIHPSLSPDDEWLAFDDSFGASGSINIGMIRTDGTGRRQLTEGPYRNRYPRFSPDGNRIAFGSNRSGSYETWTINRDGSGVKRLTDSGGSMITPVWSPDGSKIASCDNGETTYVFCVDEPWAQQSVEALPRHGEVGVKWFPRSWSPNGKLLAGYLGQLRGIVIYSFETKRYRTLTDTGGMPVWLRDSRRLLFVSSSNLQDNVPISLLDTATGEYHEVLSSELLSIEPDWIRPWPTISADDRTIYFERQRREADIWMLTLNEERE